MLLFRGNRYVALAAVLGSASLGMGQYSITEIGTFGGAASNAYGVNNLGQVVGRAQNSAGTYQAFLWAGGTLTNLGHLGGQRSEANAINDSGVIAGYSNDAANLPKGFVYNGTLSPLGTLGGERSYGYAINASGQTAGPSQIANGDYLSFVSGPGGLQSIPGISGSTFNWAFGMNDAGHVVGYSSITGTGVRAFYYNGSSTVSYGSTTTRAYDINNQGQITGFTSDFTGSSRAYLRQGSTMTDLGTLGGTTSQGYAINESGVVAGEAANAAGQTRAAIFSNGVAIDLNSYLAPNSGWVLSSARGISDTGYVVGIGTLNGVTRAFVMAPVPEPATLAILAPALLCLRRRKKATR